MDNFLRCNSLPCRKPLQQEGKAVSTSCSHIFCLDCATQLLQGRRNCPACGFRLENADDAIVTVLNPSASYKSSVLAGLAPDVIMEICTRAIAFHGYQSTQEAAFQQMLLKKAQESVSTYQREVDRLEISARTEITHLEAKVQNLQNDLTEEKRKTRELHEILRTNGRDYEKLKTQFDQSRRSAIRKDAYNSNQNTPTLRMSSQITGEPSTSNLSARMNGIATSSRPKSFFKLHEPFQAGTIDSDVHRTPRTLRENNAIVNTGSAWQTPRQSSQVQYQTGSVKPITGLRTPKGSLINYRSPRPRNSANQGLGLRTPVRAMPLPPPGSSNRPRSVQRKIFEDYQ